MDELMDGGFAGSAPLLGRLPFKLGSPSYIWPDGYAANVRKLRPFFGEIQLLVFESLEQSPIDGGEVDELLALKSDGLEYSAHLPAPSGIGRRDGGIRSILRVMEIFRPLGIRRYVLHIEKPEDGFSARLAAERIRELTALSGIAPEKICVENLQFPFGEVWDAVEPEGVSICFDAGHLLGMGGDPIAFMREYGRRIGMAHIHGVTGSGGDHLPLTALEPDFLREFARTYAESCRGGPVIIENFTAPHLAESLRRLYSALAPSQEAAVP